MFMRGELRRFIQRGLFLLAFAWGVSLICPMEANAQLNVVARLTVEGKNFVERGEVKIRSLSDGKGGTIVYNEATNTLTINNYTFTETGVYNSFIDTYVMSDYKTFRIVLNGTSTMNRTEDKRADKHSNEKFSIHLYDDAIIEGDGKLIANTAIGGPAKYVIRDCDLEINGLHYGIKGDWVAFENANVILTTESIPSGEVYSHLAALHIGNRALDGKLSIKNSVVKVKAGGQNWQSALIRDNKTATTHDIDSKVVIPEDMEVVDEEGNKLNICLYDCWDAWYFVFSKEQERGTEIKSSSKIAKSVYFICKDKGKQVTATDEVTNAINAIGTVTLNSKAQIEKARTAYNNLTSLGGDITYIKSKIYNYQKLVNAENTLDALQKQEEARIAKEAEDKAKKEQDKKQTGQSGGSANTNVEKLDKSVTVKGTRYTIKTLKLKSVKSKKKKTVTLNWTTDKKSTGYQISYSTNKNFKKSKTKSILIKNKKTKTYTIKKLKSKKTYYVRIRGYKTVDGKRHYGYWSQSKKIKIK